MATRDFSDAQEKHIAKITRGKVQSNSGGTRFGGGDVHTDKFFIEAKTPTTAKSSFSVKKDWIEKMQEQAFEQGKEESVLAFRFDPEGKDYFVLSERQFLDYMNFRESEDYDKLSM